MRAVTVEDMAKAAAADQISRRPGDYNNQLWIRAAKEGPVVVIVGEDAKNEKMIRVNASVGKLRANKLSDTEFLVQPREPDTE